MLNLKHRMCEPAEKNDASPIEQQILDYLAANPKARDTLRGVAEWWLLRQDVVRSLGDVKAALDNLVAEGKLVCETTPDGEVHYRHRPDGAREP